MEGFQLTDGPSAYLKFLQKNNYLHSSNFFKYIMLNETI